MATAQTFVPKGFTAGRHPLVSPQLAARVLRLPARVGPQRILAVAAQGAKPEAIETFFGEKPLWGARPKAPGVWELDSLVEDIALLTARKDLFQWVDIATRLSGKLPVAAGAAVTARLSGEATACEKAAKAAGGTTSGKGEGWVETKIAAAKLGELLKAEKVEAIEVL